MNQPEFDLTASRQARDAGLALTSSMHSEALDVARQEARRIAQECGRVDINIVQKVMAMRGLDLGNAAGAVFKEPCWERVGFGQADRISSHARIISIWRLKAVVTKSNA